MKNFILKGDICFAKNKEKIEIYQDSYLVCIDGLSKGIYKEIPDELKDLEVIDHSNKLIIPGMIDLHIHAPQYSFRGMRMDLELMEWLNRYTFPEEEKYANLEYAKKAYSIFVDDLKYSATTRASIFASIHRPATTLLMELLEDSGLITYVGKVNMDQEATKNLIEETPEQSANETIAWIEGINQRFHRTKPILTPRFIPSCSEALLERLKEIQFKYQLPVQSHLSENIGEIEFVRKLRPQNKFYGDCYDQYNMFGKNNQTGQVVKTIMAHCVYSEEQEVELMKANNVYIAHCPSSNTNLSSGIAPIRKYLDLNMKIGLGSDVAGGHTSSIFRVVTDTIQVSKLYYCLVNKDYPPVKFNEAFYLATKGGGSFFGKVGSFEEGYQLDALVLDDSILKHPQELSVIERLERALYLSLDEKGIVSKFVFGRKIF